MDEAGALALAELAGGCPGQALAPEADGILAHYRRIVEELLLRQGAAAERVERALALAGELAEVKEGMELLLTLLRIFCKNGMAARTAIAAGAFAPEALRARERWNLVQLSAKMAAIERTEKALARNCSRSLASEVLLLELFDCTPPPS